jgi:hypothetical protein
MARTLAFVLLAQAAFGLSIRRDEISAATLDASAFVGLYDSPLENSTFWVDVNGTLAASSAAKTQTANEWVNPFPMRCVLSLWTSVAC